MKNWILKTFFAKDLIEATRAGSIDAFAKAHEDIMHTINDETQKLATELAEKKLVALLSVVDPLSIISVDNKTKQLCVGGEPVTPIQAHNLKNEAEFLTDSSLWKILYETPKHLAHEAMFVTGEDVASMTKGRAILFTLETQKKIVDILKALSTPPPTT